MATIILFAPLIGALICGFGWRFIGEKTGQVIATALVFLAAILSWIVFLTHDPAQTTHTVLLRWIESGGAYWHMVDLLWIVLFAMLYLMRAA